MKKVFLLLFLISTYSIYSQVNSLKLDPGVNYVAVGDLDVPGDQLTVEALIHYTGNSVNIVSKHTDQSNVNYLLRIGSFEITTTAGFANFGGVAAAGVTLEQDRTYHVAATYNGAFLRYYVNGCLTGEMPWTGNMITNNLITAIGQQSNSQTEQFVGYIDEVRIWNVARTQEEIQQNMLNLPNPTTQTGLLAYYKFENNFTNVQGNAAWDGVAVGSPQFELIPEPYPSNLHLSASASDHVCENDNQGVINLAASGAYDPYAFSIDNGATFSSSPVFENLPAGTYNVSVRPENNDACVVQRTITINSKSELVSGLSTQDVDCNGNDNGSATIAPSGGNGPDYSFEWSNGNDEDVTIEDLSAGNYSVTISDSCRIAGLELVENGHFENGYTGFTTDYQVGPLTATQDQGQYNIGVDPTLFHSGFTGAGNNGGGNFMVVNGSTTPNTSIWCQSIPVNQNTYYAISFYLASMFTYSPAQIQVLANGVPLDGVYIAPNSLNSWEKHEIFWFSENETSLNLCFRNLNLEGGGNDFGMDDISVKACVSCEQVFDFEIEEPDVLALSITKADANCFGTEGVITINATGGTETYNFSIDDGNSFSTTNVFTDLTPNDYEILVADANDCEADGVVTILFPDPMQVTITTSDLTCSYSDNGEISITVEDGVAPYRYSINGGDEQTTPVFQNLEAGSYEVEVLDVNDCSYIETVVITAPDEVVLTSSLEMISCFDLTDGAIVLGASGGTGDLTYSIDGGTTFLTGNEFDNLPSGTYVLRVEDERSCFATETVELTAPDELSVTAQIQDETCLFNDGEVTLEVQGGTPTYQYSSDEGVTLQATNVFTGLSGGTYTFQVYDNNNCEVSIEVEVQMPPSFEVVTSKTDVTCFGESTGGILAEVVDGQGEYIFRVNSGDEQADGTFEGLSAGAYLLLVEDEEGCREEVEIVIEEPSQLVIDLEVTDVNCFNASNGSVDIQVTGGTPNYIYSIDGGQTTQVNASFNGLAPNQYTVTIEDANECVASSDFMVTEPSALMISLVSTSPASCPEVNDGTIQVAANGGTPNYVFYIDGVGPQSNVDFSGLSAGNYQIMVQDANSCEQTMDVNVDELEPLSVDISLDDISCNGAGDGVIRFMNANGGTGNFSYSIDGGQTAVPTTDFFNLTEGSYEVVLMDVTGCRYEDIVQIGEPDALAFEEELTHILCFGANTGVIVFSNTSGGNPPYSYSIDDGLTTQSSPIFENLSAGSYKISMYDENGCELSRFVTLTSPSAITVTSSFVDLRCFQDASGSIVLNSIAGGIAPYQVSIDGGLTYSSNTTFDGLTAGVYPVVVRDENECLFEETLTINEPDELVVNDFVNDASCYGVCDAVIGVVANGGTPPYLFEWEGSDVVQNSMEQPSICAGNYALTVSDANLCQVDIAFFVSSPDPIIADFYVKEGEYSILASEVFFKNSSIGASQYVWDFGDDSDVSFLQDPSHVYDDQKGRVYKVELVAINDYDCRDTIRQLVTVEDRLIYYVPNAFTPNGDEVNQTFKPVFNAGITVEDFSLEIYNRWGELLFVTKDPEIGWDGVYDGFVVPEGTYIWKVTLRERLTDRKVIDSGHVTVLR